MPSFEDTEKRKWNVDVTITSIKQVKDETGVHLLDDTVGEKLARDSILLCDVVFALCKLQADNRKVSDEDFGRAMAGDAIADASTALVESLTDFFQNRQQRENLRRLQQINEDATEQLHRGIAEKLERLDTSKAVRKKLDGIDLDALIDSALQTSSESSGSVPESSESTPAP